MAVARAKINPVARAMGTRVVTVLRNHVLLRITNARDFLCLLRVCQQWHSTFGAEEVLVWWLRHMCFGAETAASEKCVGSRSVIMQLRRRAVLETLDAHPQRWHVLASRKDGSNDVCFGLENVGGYFVTSCSDGTVPVWDPYKKYRWSSGKSRQAGTLPSRRQHNDGGPELVRTGTHQITLFNEPSGHISVWNVTGPLNTDLGHAGSLRIPFQRAPAPERHRMTLFGTHIHLHISMHIHSHISMHINMHTHTFTHAHAQCRWKWW